MRRLVLMSDYEADPLWDDKTGVMIPLSRLPISDSLKDRLIVWRDRWDVEASKGMLTGDEDQEPEADPEARELWMALRDELSGRYEVGMTAPAPPGETRIHVIWEPGARPELPTWMTKQRL